MASTMLRSRILSIASRTNKPNRRFFCSNKESIISSQSITSDQSAAAGEAPAQAVGGSENKAWSFFKYGIAGALTGATAFAGYASYGLFYYISMYINLPVLFSFLHNFKT